MKITCEACNAKYSIADDRVAGKTFKIRCKKCSHVIVLRGTPAAEPEVSTSGAWHAVIDGTQRGPFERVELARRRDAGELDDDTHVWREGMSDWVALGTVEELRPQPGATLAVEPPDAMRLKNERNESSVLFTLGNLTRLAASPPVAARATSTVPGEEGSGLIDIRALASTWSQPSAIAKPVSTGAQSDLPIYAATGIADPIVLVPTPRGHGIDRRLVYALVAMLAMVAGLAAVLVIVLTRETAQAAVVAPAPVVEAPAAVVEAPIVGAPQAPQAAPPPPAPVTRVPEVAPPPLPRKTRTSRKSPPRTPAVAPAPPAPVESCTEVSCTVNDYEGTCCDAFRPRRSTTTAPDLPENLDRAALAKGIATIKAQRCGASSSAKGDVSVSVKVTAEGTVAGVTVKQTPDQALAACVVKEAKRGTFAKTRRGGSFAYFWRF